MHYIPNTLVHIYKITCLMIEHTNIYKFDSHKEITITGTRAHLYSITRDNQ